MNEIKIGRAFWVGFAFAAAAMLSFAPEAHACAHHDKAHEGEGGHRGKAFKKMKPAQLIERFDKNGDGVLALSELPELMRKRLAEADTNGDGKLSEEELRVRLDAIKGKRGEYRARFEKLDKNGDGVLTRDEVGDRWEWIAKADADKDGKVTKEELQHARAAMKTSKKTAKKAGKKER